MTTFTSQAYFAECLERFQRQTGLTLGDIAKRLGIPRTLLSNLKTTETISLKTYKKYAEVITTLDSLTLLCLVIQEKHPDVEQDLLRMIEESPFTSAESELISNVRAQLRERGYDVQWSLAPEVMEAIAEHVANAVLRQAEVEARAA